MSRLAAIVLALICLCLGAGVPDVSSQGPKKKTKVAANPSSAEQMRVMMELLNQRMDPKDLQDKVKLKQALEYFSDKHKLTILVDREAFLAALGPEDADLYEEEVSLPPLRTKMIINTALRLIVSQVGKGEATFVIRRGHIEITTLKASTSANLMYPLSIVASFEKRPLREVLQELSYESGLEIHLDPAAGAQAEFPISARFRNNSLEDALVIVTEMAELKYVVLERSVFVTTPNKVEALRREENDRATKRKDFKVLPRAKRLEPAAE